MYTLYYMLMVANLGFAAYNVKTKKYGAAVFSFGVFLLMALFITR